jgi:hypothetical protein
MRGRWRVAFAAAEGPGGSPIGWQEAVARLARERTLAVAAAAALKKYGDAGAKDRGALAYAAAKAEYDGIIAGLSVALANHAKPSSLPDLEAMLQSGFAKRVAFCDSATALMAASAPGQKGFTIDIASGTIEHLIDAVKAIWLRHDDASALARQTIQTQIEATAWPAFDSIPSAP